MITFITPTHNTKYIYETYNSLLSQTDNNWKWIILTNNGVKVNIEDSRVNIIEYSKETHNIGELKKYAFSLATTELVAELDHDDLLTPDAVDEIKKAFVDQTIGFVYSDCAEFWDKTYKNVIYSSKYGWEYRDDNFYGHCFKTAISFEPSPHSVSLIYYAPNHIRVWRKSVYDQIGGHNEKLQICDDHDILCRTYLNTKMYKIPKCLYLYRCYKEQSFRVYNADIQTKTHEIYEKYIVQLTEKWCELNNYKKIDLCGGINSPKNYISLDLQNSDIICDLNNGIPMGDNSVGIVRANDALEHIKNPVKIMNEIYRVLVHGGMLFVNVPSTDGRGAFQDPTHISFWNSNSFWYYTKKEYAKYVSDIKCRFQIMKLKNYYPSEFHKTHHILYTSAHLMAIKEGYRYPGAIEI